MSFKFCYCSKPLFCSYLQCYKKNFKSSEQVVVVVLDIWSFENMVSENFCGSDLNAEFMVRFKEWNGMLTSFFNTLSLIAWRRGHSKSGMICPFRIWEYILNHFFFKNKLLRFWMVNQVLVISKMVTESRGFWLLPPLWQNSN